MFTSSWQTELLRIEEIKPTFPDQIDYTPEDNQIIQGQQEKEKLLKSSSFSANFSIREENHSLNAANDFLKPSAN